MNFVEISSAGATVELQYEELRLLGQLAKGEPDDDRAVMTLDALCGGFQAAAYGCWLHINVLPAIDEDRYSVTAMAAAGGSKVGPKDQVQP